LDDHYDPLPPVPDLVADVTDSDGLTNKDRAFLDVLFDEHGGDVRRAMDAVGYSKSTPTSHITKKLGKHIKERTKEYLLSNTGKAAISIVNVLTDPSAPGQKNSLAAAKEILDRGGVFKEEAPQITEIRNMFILPSKDEAQED
jgi:hypothetical protein